MHWDPNTCWTQYWGFKNSKKNNAVLTTANNHTATDTNLAGDWKKHTLSFVAKSIKLS